MPNQTSPQNPKHLKGFWPIFIIVVVSAIAGGVIVFFASNNILQDNIDSISFTVGRHITTKAPAPSPVMHQ